MTDNEVINRAPLYQRYCVEDQETTETGITIDEVGRRFGRSASARITREDSGVEVAVRPVVLRRLRLTWEECHVGERNTHRMGHGPATDVVVPGRPIGCELRNA